MNVLAIDQGTSSTNALILAPTGDVLGQGETVLRWKPHGLVLSGQDRRAAEVTRQLAGRR